MNAVTTDALDEQEQEILDIIGKHGPLESGRISARAKLSIDHSEVSSRLFNLKTRGLIVRHPDKTYTTREWVTGKPTPRLDKKARARIAAQAIADLEEKAPANVPRDEKGSPDELPPELVAQFNKKTRNNPKKLAALQEELNQKVPANVPRVNDTNRAPRLEDLESKPEDPVAHDPIETVLRDALYSAQSNLDAFIREAGDLAAIMATLIDCRDKTRDALNTYQRGGN